MEDGLKVLTKSGFSTDATPPHVTPDRVRNKIGHLQQRLVRALRRKVIAHRDGRPVLFKSEPGFAHSDTSHAKLDKLDMLLAQTSTSIEDAALIAEMLSINNDGRYPALDLAPPERRERTL
jgi:hypothetical protein